MRAQSRTICVFSAKGGVGKTFVCVNLAISLLKQTQSKVLLIDVSLPSRGDIVTFLGGQEVKTFSDLIPYLSKVDYRMLSGLISTHSTGLSVISGSLENGIPVDDFEKVQKIWGMLPDIYDYIIIDAGSYLSESILKIFDISHLIFLVTTPDVLAVSQTRRLLENLQLLHFPREMIKVLLNRATAKGAVSSELVQSSFRRDIFTTISDDNEVVSQSILQGMPVVLGFPRHQLSWSIDDLIQKLTGEKTTGEARKGGLLATLKEAGRRGLAKLEGGDATVLFMDSGQVSAKPQKQEISEDWENRIIEMKLRVHKRLVDEMNLKQLDTSTDDPQKRQELRTKTERHVAALLDEEGAFITSREERARLIKEMLDEALGLGALEELLANSEITEIMVNSPSQIFIEKKGKITLAKSRFINNEQLMGVIERIVAPLGRRIDERSPMVDARLKDGSRVNAIIPPLALNGATLTIRKFPLKALNASDLVRLGSLVQQMVQFIDAAVKVRKNIIISGGTGSGKTTLLNILSGFIPHDERIITVEDSAELRLPQEHVVRLEARPPNIEGQGAIPIRELVRNALRMRPDRIVVGECRGGEALDMLQAMNTGHDGSLTTIHANTTADALSRIETLSLMAGLDLPSRAIRDQIASAINVIVQVDRLSDGSRKIIEVAELIGQQDGHFIVKPVFVFKQTGVSPEGKVIGKFVATGHVPEFVESLDKMGIILPREIFWDSSNI